MLIVISKRKAISLFFLSVFIFFTFIVIFILLVIKNNSHPKPVAKNEPDFMIIIFIEQNKLYLFKDDRCIKEYPIASGKPGWPSPIGCWKIINKGDWGEGFGGSWLGLNVPWGTYGIHGTNDESSIGSEASHGCIRMFSKDAKELYEMVPIGTPVLIKNGAFGPFGTGFRELYPGDRGADVLAVQQRLKALGYYKGNETGIYEDDLKYALHKFQKDKKLPVKDNITLADYRAMGFLEFE